MSRFIVIFSLAVCTLLTGCGTTGSYTGYVLPQRHGAFSSGLATQEFYYRR